MQHWIILAHLTSAALENAAHFATSENYAGIEVTIMNGKSPTSDLANSPRVAKPRVGNWPAHEWGIFSMTPLPPYGTIIPI